MKKILFIILGSIISVGIFIAIILFLLPTVLHVVAGKDDPMIDDSALIPAVVSTTDSGNAHSQLHAINFKDQDLSLTVKWLNFANPGQRTAIDWDKANTILQSNQSQLNQYNLAAKQRYYQSPLTSDPKKFRYDGELEGYNLIRNAGRVAALNALRLAEQGKIEPAIDQVINIYSVGYLMQKSNSQLISNLVGISQSQLAIDVFQEISQKYTLPVGQKNYFANYLKTHSDTSAGLKSVIQYEYLTSKQGIDDITSGKFDSEYQDVPEDQLSDEFKAQKRFKGNKFYFKPNQTKNELIKYLSEQLSYVDKPCEYKSSYVPFNAFTVKSLITENYVGKTLNSSFLTSHAVTFSKPCELDKSINEIIKS